MNDLVSLITEDLAILKEENKTIYFTISSTSGNSINYLTPIRKFSDIVILGLVTSDIKFLKHFLPKVDAYADYIFVDIEKKLHPVVDEFGRIQSNNFLHKVKQILPERIIYPFMPNDLTVQSVWNQVVKDVIELKNSSVFLIGLGNIGAKVALRLAETGCKVLVKSRTDSYKVYHTVEALNRIKHAGAIGEVSVTNSLEKGLLQSNIVILAANSSCIIDKKYTEILKAKERIIGIARNNMFPEQMKELDNYLSIDVGIELFYGLKSIIDQFEKKENRTELEGKFKYVGSGLHSDSEIVYDYSSYKYVGARFIDGKFIRLSANELYDLG